MRALSIIIICCLALLVTSVLQANTCKSTDPVNDPTPCTRLWGATGCAILFYTIWMLYKKK